MTTDKFIDQYFVFPFEDTIVSLIDDNHHFDMRNIEFSLVDNELFAKEKINSHTIDGDFQYMDHTKENGLIICIKDNPKLLSFCLDQIRKQEIDQYCDIIIVDDRPTSDSNLQIVKSFQYNYCKITNSLDIFNYSVLNNIAACYASIFHKKRLIFWNSDMWSDNHNTLPQLLNKHISHNSSITGIKLIYPQKKDYEKIFSEYNHVLGEHINKFYGTIQHGGIFFIPSRSVLSNNQPMYLPSHLWRFYEADHQLASIDTRCFAVTGACHVIETGDFIKLGGYACSLAAAYQDIDICQRAVEKNMSVYYIGSEQMYHAETITNDDGKKFNTSPIYLSDKLAYTYVWQSKIQNLLGIQK